MVCPPLSDIGIFIYENFLYYNMITSNSSPLIHLTRLGKIEFLFEFVKKINIPEAVFDEVITQGKEKKYSEAYIIERFIREEKIEVIKLKGFDSSFYPPLGRGEIEALELARQKNELLLIDEKKARNVAQILKIEHQTTLTTMFELLISGIINSSEYISNIKKYAGDSWISADVIQNYLEMGERYGR